MAPNDHPLRYRDFRLMLIGRIASMVGTQMQHVALAWHVFQLTDGNPLALGAIGLARAVPIILTALTGGVVADTFDRRRVLIVTQLLWLLISGALAVTTLTGHASLFLLYAATAASGVVIAFDNPARQAIIANLVPPGVLSRAMSMSSTAFNISRVVGPAIAGILLTVTGPGTIYAIDGGTFLIMLFCVVAVRYQPVKRAAVQPVFEAIREGLAFIRRTPVVRSTMFLDFFATFFADALLLLPIFATQLLKVGTEGYGALLAAHGFGAVVVGLVLSTRRLPRRQGLTIIVSVLIYGMAYAAFGASDSFVLSMALLALAGAADTVSAVMRMTLRQILTPDELRGRMNSINMIFFIGGPQLGEMEAGLVAEFYGARVAVVSGGLACILLAGIFSLNRPLREYEGGSHSPDRAG